VRFNGFDYYHSIKLEVCGASIHPALTLTRFASRADAAIVTARQLQPSDRGGLSMSSDCSSQSSAESRPCSGPYNSVTAAGRKGSRAPPGALLAVNRVRKRFALSIKTFRSSPGQIRSRRRAQIVSIGAISSAAVSGHNGRRPLCEIHVDEGALILCRLHTGALVPTVELGEVAPVPG
jgi:hypothetical protein